jgi:uncharacterized protein
MRLEQIRSDQETAEGLPAEALAAAVTQAEALAPEVVALLVKAIAGVHLLPRQDNLLFFGLYAMAAARRTEICAPFLTFLRCPEWQLEQQLGDGVIENATGLLLGFYDGNPEPLFAAIEDRDAGSSIRWTAFLVLARLCWEGRVPRERLVALLARFDREAMAEPKDLVWIGWEDAIRLLGIEALMPQVRRSWEGPRGQHQRQADRDDWLNSLARAVADPRDPQPFIENGAVPVTDPVVSLDWFVRLSQASKAEDSQTQEERSDPARAFRLDKHELDWLRGFLESEQVGPTSLSLEHLDGYFTALVIGPDEVPPSEYLKLVWGMPSGGEPRFDSPEQAFFVKDLLARHWKTIAARVGSLTPHRPIIFPIEPEDRGKAWGEGFTMGLQLRQEAWAPIFGHRHTAPVVWSILSLIADAYDSEAKPLSLKERGKVLELLPISILAISTYWRDPEMREPLKPVRSEKIGRNQPCPCGSGRKYKKCCGAAA